MIFQKYLCQSVKKRKKIIFKKIFIISKLRLCMRSWDLGPKPTGLDTPKPSSPVPPLLLHSPLHVFFLFPINFSSFSSPILFYLFGC